MTTGLSNNSWFMPSSYPLLLLDQGKGKLIISFNFKCANIECRNYLQFDNALHSCTLLTNFSLQSKLITKLFLNAQGQTVPVITINLRKPKAFTGSISCLFACRELNKFCVWVGTCVSWVQDQLTLFSCQTASVPAYHAKRFQMSDVVMTCFVVVVFRQCQRHTAIPIVQYTHS